MGDEVVLGDIAVVSRLALGTERLRLFLTTRRIIVAHVGKRGAGAIPGTSIFGKMSGALEDLFKSGRESVEKRKLERSLPEEILASDKGNFQIGYEEVVSVDVTSDIPALTTLVILTRDEKFEFFTAIKLRNVLELLEKPLGPKLAAG